MKERPIIFCGEMVEAILKGKKTQTRRIVGPQPIAYGKSSYGGTRSGWVWRPDTLNRSWNDDDADPYRCKEIATVAMAGECPYGQVGDRLWVRETFAQCGTVMDERIAYIAYRADAELTATSKFYPQIVPSNKSFLKTLRKWRPSIHMPRWASRITLEITNIRVERVQDIKTGGYLTKSDVQKEGCPFDNKPELLGSDEEEWFIKLWNSINAKRGYSWESNLWVWVIEFKRFAICLK